MTSKFVLSKSYSSKITLAFLLVILFSTLFISLSFYYESNSVLKRNVRESTIQISEQTAESLSFIIDTGINTSDFIASDPTIQRATMQSTSKSREEQKINANYINTLLNNFVYSNSFVKIVYVLEKNGSGWGSGTFSDTRMKKIKLTEQKWVKESERKDGELVWQGLQYDNFSGGGVNTELTLPVGRVLKDFDTLKNIGYIQVHLDGRSILNTIGKMDLGKTGKFFVVNHEGQIMIDSNLNLINKKVENPTLFKKIVNDKNVEFEFSVEGVPYYGVKQPLSNGWLLIGTVPINEISGQLNQLQSKIFFSTALLSFLAIVIGLLIARRVTKPVKKLTQSMMQVQQGNLKVRTTINSSDEIGFLSQQFNKMLFEIENLLQQIEKEQSEKYHAELRAVIHRVHPHFLYNTLSTLRWLIDSNQNDRASSVLSALTHLLEANMGKSGNIIMVEEEINIIRKYLTILELRYEKEFHLDLNIESGAEKLPIPRMLLQPLVENAIFHGIVPKNIDGKITIKINAPNNSLEIIVKDNGLGIEKDKLLELNDEENENTGIGLRHILDTLRLYYPGKWEWSISSIPEEGTTARILIKEMAESAQKN